MKDHLFTMTPEMPGLPPEMQERMQEEMRRNFLRMKHFAEMVMTPKSGPRRARRSTGRTSRDSGAMPPSAR